MVLMAARIGRPMSPKVSAGWTPEREKAVKRWWSEGKSASWIAEHLGGGATRNAVIGKVHRLGLVTSGREKPAVPSPVKPTTAHRPSFGIAGNGTMFERGEVRPPHVVVDYPEEAAGSVTIMTAKAHHCRWPIGEGSGLSFCGKPRRDELVSYCPDHCRIAFQGQVAANGRRIPNTRELERSLRRFT